jgi:hypothetical protein
MSSSGLVVDFDAEMAKEREHNEKRIEELRNEFTKEIHRLKKEFMGDMLRQSGEALKQMDWWPLVAVSPFGLHHTWSRPPPPTPASFSPFRIPLLLPFLSLSYLRSALLIFFSFSSTARFAHLSRPPPKSAYLRGQRFDPLN